MLPKHSTDNFEVLSDRTSRRTTCEYIARSIYDRITRMILEDALPKFEVIEDRSTMRPQIAIVLKLAGHKHPVVYSFTVDTFAPVREVILKQTSLMAQWIITNRY